jgi:hypothetical protein
VINVAPSPWVVLLCKFKDDDTEPFGRQHYLDLFTSSGQGTQNMVDYFSDCSHGNIDIGGSEVKGWYTLDKNRADYVGSGANNQGRNDLIDWAKQKAIDTDNVDFSRYAGVLVCMNVATDLFGGAHGAVCGANNTTYDLEPSLLGQEMGHVYGLKHSRLDGSDVDYRDRWDTMSTANAWETADQRWVHVGPGLNAANMYGRGWLDLGRTVVVNNSVQTVHLRPLHRRDLPGALALLVGDYFVEYRARARWDASIPQPSVLVHTLVDDVSYLMLNTAGSQEFLPGSVFERGSSEAPWARWTRIEVTGIDADSDTATVQVLDRSAERVPVVGPGEIFGGLTHDGDGWIVVNGKAFRVPPRSPVRSLLEHLALLADAETVQMPAARDAMRREGYHALGATVSETLEHMDGFHGPPPLSMDH